MLLGQLFFTGNVGGRAYGWSEGFWHTTVNDLTAGIAELTDLGNIRKMLLGGGIKLEYLRVSLLDVNRDSQVEPGFVPRPISPSLGNQVLPNQAPLTNSFIYNNDLTTEAVAFGRASDVMSDMPWTGVLLRLEGGAPFTQRRSLLIRGVPDYITDSRLSRPLPGGNWGIALSDFRDKLINAKWGFKALSQVAPANVRQIVAINTAVNPPVFTATGAPWALPAVVRISKTLLKTPGGLRFGLNGVFTVNTVNVVNPGQFTFTVDELVSPFLGAIIMQMGQVQQRLPVLVPFVKEVDRRYGKRETGGPFDRPLGRRRKPGSGRSSIPAVRL